MTHTSQVQSFSMPALQDLAPLGRLSDFFKNQKQEITELQEKKFFEFFYDI
jgi:hypothetical protein